MKVAAIKCPNCGDTIYSRARHDFRTCSCGECSIDGGFDYVSVSAKKGIPECFQIEVNATKSELALDWNNGKDKFGLIKGGQE